MPEIQRIDGGSLRKTGALNRVNIAEIEPILLAAQQLLIPKNQSQRKVFEALMPYLYPLRKKGCSFEELTKLLSDSGMKLQISTVRVYYGEFLVERMDACQAMMTEQLLLAEELRKQNGQNARPNISQKFDEMMARQAPANSAKIDSIFGLSGAAHAAPEVEKNKPPLAAKSGVGLLPAGTPAKEVKKSPPVISAGDDLPIPRQMVAVAGDAHATPVIQKTDLPVLKNSAPAARALDSSAAVAAGGPLDGSASVAVVGGLRCALLNRDVPELARRPEINDDVYKEGLLEHPAISGLFLSLSERLYGLALEIVDANGEIRLESANEKRFRVKWVKPIPRTPSRTEGDFVTMDMSLFVR